ncbi:MAG: RNA methyltransferase [Saprospiraceae bacterium]|nr:RNA methyltransferase [Saprospiraceae bacterium]MCC7504590.1 RNA methyltransferase [Saprospiraceae bacterium]
MQPEREKKIRDVIRQSQPDLTVVLENIFDPLNISAVLRSCDAVGIREVFVVYTKQYLDKRGLILGKRTSAGTFKWIDVYVFDDLEECFRRVRERYGRILATRLGEDSQSLYSLDLTQPTALLFGNEDEGISSEALALADGNFLIPQAGFAESLNISVACAVSLFEARRQRAEKGFYDKNPKLDATQQEQLFQRWGAMLKEKSWHRQFAIPVGKDSAPLLPVFVERDEHAPPKKQIRPNPLTKFDL